METTLQISGLFNAVRVPSKKLLMARFLSDWFSMLAFLARYAGATCPSHGTFNDTT